MPRMPDQEIFFTGAAVAAAIRLGVNCIGNNPGELFRRSAHTTDLPAMPEQPTQRFPRSGILARFQSGPKR